MMGYFAFETYAYPPYAIGFRPEVLKTRVAPKVRLTNMPCFLRCGHLVKRTSAVLTRTKSLSTQNTRVRVLCRMWLRKEGLSSVKTISNLASSGMVGSHTSIISSFVLLDSTSFHTVLNFLAFRTYPCPSR